MTDPEAWPFSVKWSSKLENLADELLKRLQMPDGSADPFRKICIVVHDSVTENWLKQYWLLDRKISRILIHVEFVRLPEFINDFLAAAVRGTDPRSRHAAEHPYSPEILIWRIYRKILAVSESDDDLKELREYAVKDGDPQPDPLKSYVLSKKLAELYDDYLNSRCQMLRNWETGQMTGAGTVPRWQIRLYQQLAAEDPRTYAADYEKAFSAGWDAKAAFAHGFPRYQEVHIFDIPFMPEPVLHLLEKISGAFPVTFWTFNPQADAWLGESPSVREAVSRLRKKLQKEWKEQRTELQRGWLEPAEFSAPDMQAFYDSPAERLFGALASGARPMIRNLCSDSEGRVDVVGRQEALAELPGLEIQIHRTYSPRRELEAVKDGLLDFFARNKEVLPYQAVVLCADWENMAPVIESVFSSSPDSEGFIPVTVSGRTAGDTPFGRSLQDLLAFRENRFEVDAVFDLLSTPAIQQKFELDAQTVSELREMVKKANIHWGYDDEDVRRILDAEKAPPEGHYPYTWQRGLDRMISEWFHGFREEEYAMLKAGSLGALRPCGEVEGARSEAAAKLWDFVDQLHQLRLNLAPETEGSPDGIRDLLQETLRRFYVESDEAFGKEFRRTMQTVSGIARQMTDAGVEKVRMSVFIAALFDTQKGCVSGMRTPGDAVLFAPLGCSSAMPHEFVWICGLNDGVFPKIGHRASYDVIGKHPSLFDVSAREKDSFALLKAVLSARKRLCLSFIGKDIHTNEEIPSSVLLSDLLDFFAAQEILYIRYEHPMHAYSQRYFLRNQEPPLPPSYSRLNEKIAQMLMHHDTLPGPVPFSLSSGGVTDLQLEDLVSFFSKPNLYLFSAQGINVPRIGYDRLSSKESLAVRLDKRLQTELVLTGRSPSPNAAPSQVETGNAPDKTSAEAEMEEVRKSYDAALAKDYGDFLQISKKDASAELGVKGGRVCIHMQYAVLCRDERKSMIFYDNYPDSNSTKNKIRLQYLGANAAEGGISAVLFGPGIAMDFPELTGERAREILTEIVVMGNSPLPADFPDYRKTGHKEDVLPQEWQRELDALLPAVNRKKQKKG